MDTVESNNDIQHISQRMEGRCYFADGLRILARMIARVYLQRQLDLGGKDNQGKTSESELERTNGRESGDNSSKR